MTYKAVTTSSIYIKLRFILTKTFLDSLCLNLLIFWQKIRERDREREIERERERGDALEMKKVSMVDLWTSAEIFFEGWWCLSDLPNNTNTIII